MLPEGRREVLDMTIANAARSRGKVISERRGLPAPNIDCVPEQHPSTSLADYPFFHQSSTESPPNLVWST